MAGTRISMSRSPPPDPIKLGTPALSPDGKLVALGVTFDEFLPRLAVFDIDREELVVVGRPDNEGWLSPTFSPSGDRIAFIRYCVEECAVGTQGFQVAILDRKSGATTTVTSGRDVYRGSPLFSPDGQSIVFGSRNLVWKDDWLARGLKWRHRRPHAGAGGGTLRRVGLKTGFERKILSDRFGVTQFSTAFPSEFLDENTLIFSARHPSGSRMEDSLSPLFRELKRLVGAKDAKYRFYLYRLALGEKLEFMSPDAPRRIGRSPVSPFLRTRAGWRSQVSRAMIRRIRSSWAMTFFSATARRSGRRRRSSHIWLTRPFRSRGTGSRLWPTTREDETGRFGCSMSKRAGSGRPV